MASNRGKKQARPGVEQQRQAILAAAVELFASSGSAAVSVSMLCQYAGVSRDTFYRCYDNKGQLVDTLYSVAISERMLGLTSSPDAQFDDPAWLRQAVDTMVNDILAQHLAARFLYIEAADPASRAHRVMREAHRKTATHMQGWCRRKHGSSPSLLSLMGLLSGSQWMVLDLIDSEMSPRQVRTTKNAIEELFLATFRGFALTG